MLSLRVSPDGNALAEEPCTRRQSARRLHEAEELINRGNIIDASLGHPDEYPRSWGLADSCEMRGWQDFLV